LSAIFSLIRFDGLSETPIDHKVITSLHIIISHSYGWESPSPFRIKGAIYPQL